MPDPRRFFELCDRLETRAAAMPPEPLCPHDRDRDSCPQCGEEEAERHRVAWLARDRATALEECAVPPRYRVDFARWAEMAWDGNPWAVVLWGGVGAGKTCHAVELLWRWLRPRHGRHATARFVRAADIPGLAYGSDRRGYDDILAAPLLLIDDLGRGYKGDAVQAVGEVIAYRYDRLLPTIITTNGETDHEMGDPAAADRLREALRIKLRGSSRRKAGA